MQPGAIVREAWELYKAHWRTFVPLALIVYIVLGLITLVFGLLLGWLGLIIGALASIVGTFWLQGALVEAVQDVRDGKQDLSIGEMFRRVQPRLPALIVAGILAGLGIALGLVLLIVPGLFLLTIWSLIVPTIVLEGKSAGESFGRSRELVKGNGWSVFGVIAITIGAVIVASIIVGLLTFWLPDGVDSFVSDLISNTLVVPFVAVAWTLMYFALAQGRTAAPTAAAEAYSPPPPPPSDGPTYP
ncbi:MAG: glycerophosphoryl diester phosphodiesterase membrane domain-containing protein [Actinobacteria bacterium]|nr:glycerophosphoryl diester phosphodiesterase membrane domain-containing protein [Actinomycetota bacterium]